MNSRLPRAADTSRFLQKQSAHDSLNDSREDSKESFQNRTTLSR